MPLYVVAVPIGHPDDITHRAIKTLGDVDFLICEELKPARRMLKTLGIKKELYQINEHNERDDTEEIITLLKENKSAALFSDCGTPLFADPGTFLIKRCHETGIKIAPIPGASSLTAALSVAGVDTKQFYYAGFLPRSSDERCQEIQKLNQMTCTIVIYDTPYRLLALLEDLQKELNVHRLLTILFSLTQPQEKIWKGTVGSMIKKFKQGPIKQEFVLVIDPVLIKKKKPVKKIKTRKRK
jgi:16S rRNA (cytidine1402-2'-O)-methyltransferase